jgi:hypothetical protein
MFYDIYLYTLCYYICCLLGACMRCTRLCSLKPGVTRTSLGGLESANDAKPSHGLHAVLSSLWGRGYPAHRLRIRFPENEGVRRPKQSNQPRRLTGPAGRGSGHGLTTLGTVSAVPATLPRPRGSVPRPPGGRLGASATTRRPRASQAHASLGRAIYHRQDFEARNIQAGQ